MRYLLDANAIADLVHDGDGIVARRLQRHGIERVCTSVIVAAELRYGAAKKGSARLAADIHAVLGALAVQPFEHPADARYGELRADLERRGRPIGANDMLIAAHTLALDCILVTADKAFGRVRALRTENWLARR